MRAVEPGSLPQLAGDEHRIDFVCLPPSRFVTVSVQRAMVTPAQRDCVFVAHSTADSSWLGKTEMMGVARPSATDQAWLRRHESEVRAVAVAAWFAQRESAFVDVPSDRVIDVPRRPEFTGQVS
jgi:hypothetical protein